MEGLLVLGAYGLRVRGLPEAAVWMQAVDPDADELAVRAEVSPPDWRSSQLGPDHADLRLIGGGRLVARRGVGEARFSLPTRATDADLLHPYLAGAAGLAQRWCGRAALHAGAVATPGGAVVVLGDKAAGKSSTLAWLAAERDETVLTDDLVVVDGGRALSGPRCIDLRQPVVAAYGRRWATEPVRFARRTRLALPPGPEGLSLAGCVVLEWGRRLSVDRVPFRQRLAMLTRQHMFAGVLAPDPLALLDIAALPMVRITRPRHLGVLPAAAGTLIDYWR